MTNYITNKAKKKGKISKLSKTYTKFPSLLQHRVEFVSSVQTSKFCSCKNMHQDDKHNPMQYWALCPFSHVFCSEHDKMCTALELPLSSLY